MFSPAGFVRGFGGHFRIYILKYCFWESKTRKSNVQANTSKLKYARIIVHVHAN